MDSLLSWAQAKQPDFIAFLRELVECESPSDNPASIGRFVDLVTAKLSGMAGARVFHGSGHYGPNVQFEFNLPGSGNDGQILALGHSDTVYSMGTLASMPFRADRERLWGPGVLDMKGGIAMFIFAMRGIRELGRRIRKQVDGRHE